MADLSVSFNPADIATASDAASSALVAASDAGSKVTGVSDAASSALAAASNALSKATIASSQIAARTDQSVKSAATGVQFANLIVGNPGGGAGGVAITLGDPSGTGSNAAMNAGCTLAEAVYDTWFIHVTDSNAVQYCSFYGFPLFEVDSACHIDRVCGFRHDGGYQSAGSGTVNNYYGIYISSANLATNEYGGYFNCPVGINVLQPSNALEVKGNINITSGAFTVAGSNLISDAVSKATAAISKASEASVAAAAVSDTASNALSKATVAASQAAVASDAASSALAAAASVSDAASNALSKATKASSAAAAVSDAASNALSKATVASAAASNALSVANAASSMAGEAHSEAELASKAAAGAVSKAIIASSKAVIVSSLASDAMSAASDAASKATVAMSKASDASSAAIVAYSKASDASSAAAAASDAASNAQSKITARSATWDKKIVILKVYNEASAIASGDGKMYFTVPALLNGMNLISVGGHLYTAATSGVVGVQIANVTSAADMLSANKKLEWDVTEKDTATAAAASQAVINTATDNVLTGEEIRIDIDAAASGAKGMEIRLTFQTP